MSHCGPNLFSFKAIAALVFLSMMLLGCASLLPPSRTERTMESNGGSYFLLSDRGLDVSLRIGPGKLFDWRFKNTGDKTLRLDMASLALLRQGDSTAYALWGEPQQNVPETPFVTLEPGGYANYRFPVRSKSPFWPFRPESAEAYQLRFTVRWGYRDYHYLLGFESY